MGFFAVAAFVGACVIMGPRRVIPRLAETIKMTREHVGEAMKAADEAGARQAVMKKVEGGSTPAAGASSAAKATSSIPNSSESTTQTNEETAKKH